MIKGQIEQALRDYHWMVKEIARLRAYLESAGERLVRQYGIESDMPKPKGSNTDPVHMEVERRDKQWDRVAKLEKKVLLIQDRMHLINEERERTVLDCLLDGMSYVAISRHMGLSTRHIQRIRADIVSDMSRMSDLSANLQEEKSCV